jgi:hypothetical protein
MMDARFSLLPGDGVDPGVITETVGPGLVLRLTE